MEGEYDKFKSLQQQEEQEQEQIEFDPQNILNEYYFKHENDDFLNQMNTPNDLFHDSGYSFLPQQTNVMIPNGDPMLNSFQHESSNITPRKEQDVFCELIALANKSRTFQYNTPSFSTNYLQEQIRQQQHNNYLAKSAAATALAGPSNRDRIYKLTIAQQPLRARMCGFGDKDRRPISPPPIVQLVVTNKFGQIINPETFDTSFLVLMCDSCQHNESGMQVISLPTNTTKRSSTDDDMESNGAIKMRNLVGSSVSSASKLYDLNGELGIFFIFQDVSLRTEGCFRLKFSLIDVGTSYSHHLNTSTISHVLKTIQTEPFIVYTAKKFPGVVQSTPLSKSFARQGIKIPIRKEKSIQKDFPDRV